MVRRKNQNKKSETVVTTQVQRMQPRVQPQPNRQPQPQPSRSQRRRRNRRRRGGSARSATNDYLSSLIDPENHPGAKVPDLVSFPSSTFQLTADLTVSCANDGDGISAILNPFFSYGSDTVDEVKPIMIGGNTSVGGNYQYSFGGSYANHRIAWTAEAAIRNAFDQVRPVSAVLMAEYIGKSTDDSGQICMGILPRVSVTTELADVLSYNTAVSQAQTKAIPLRNGAVVTWKPQDSLDLEYQDTHGWGGLINNADSATSSVLYPAIFIATAGMTLGASMRIRIVTNFEAVSNVDTAIYTNPTPAQIDLGSLQSAMRWAQHMYNNMHPFIETVGPFVNQMSRMVLPALGRNIASTLQQRISGYGDTLRSRNQLTYY